MAQGTIFDASTPFAPENLGTEEEPAPRLAVRCACTVTRETDGVVSVALQLGDRIIKARQFPCSAGVPKAVELTHCFEPASMDALIYSMRVVGDRAEVVVVEPAVSRLAYKDTASAGLRARILWHQAQIGRLRAELLAISD
jgi:hypothetical protein